LWWKKKKPKCEHRWHKLLERQEFVYEHIGWHVNGDYEDRVYVFCPLCKTRKVVSKFEWELQEKEQEILNKI
jgi:hypothetical protein